MNYGYTIAQTIDWEVLYEGTVSIIADRSGERWSTQIPLTDHNKDQLLQLADHIIQIDQEQAMQDCNYGEGLPRHVVRT